MAEEKEKIIKFTQEDLELIDLEDNEEIDDSLDELKEQKILSKDNYTIKGKLYFRIFNLFKSVKESLKTSKRIYEYINNLTLPEEFESDIEYFNSKKYGNYFAEQRIKDYVVENKENINTLIDLFFQITEEK